MKHPLLIDQPPDMPLAGPGSRRTRIGNAVEELVCRIMGWDRVSPGGSDVYRPDAHTRTKQPVEIKSVSVNGRLNGKSVIYDWRMEKDRVHAPSLAYAFFCYPDVKSPASLAVFLDRLACGPIWLAMVPAWLVREDAMACPPCKAPVMKGGKRPGWCRAGYADGYRNLSVGQYLRNPGFESETTARVWDRSFSVIVSAPLLDPWIPDPRQHEGTP